MQNLVYIAKLSDFVKEKVKEILGTTLKTNEIIVTKEQMTHFSPILKSKVKKCQF